MTDKEKLDAIRAEVEEYISAARKAHTNITEGNFAHLLSFIDSLQEEPVSEEWIEELRTKLDSMSKEDFKKVFDKYAVDFNEEPVSEELEEAAIEYCGGNKGSDARVRGGFLAGAKWQKEQFEKDYTNLCKGIATAKGLAVTMAYDKGMADAREQMMANTADAMIGLPYENKDGGYTHLIDVSRPLPVGNNKIAIIFKEE